MKAQTAPTLSDLVGTWTLDPDRTTVQLQTTAMWVLPVKGTLHASQGLGTVDASGEVTGRIVVDAASIDTKNKKRDDHLRSEDFFEVTKYPTITFEVGKAHVASPGQTTLAGELTIRGITRPVEVQGAVAVEPDGSITVAATAVVDRSEFGMSWAKMGAGLSNRISVSARYRRS